MVQPVAAVTTLALLAAAVDAQLTVRAIARTDLVAYTDAGRQTVPANTDITNGRTVSMSGSNYGTADARSSFRLSATTSAVAIGLDERASASGGSGILQASAGVGESFSPHGIDLQLSSSTPMLVRVVVTVCQTGGGYSGTLTIPGQGTVDNALGALCQAPVSRSFDVPVTSTPTVLSWSTRATANGARGGTSVDARWTITMTHIPPCPGVASGAPCGAELTSVGTLALPGTWLTLTDTTPPQAAFLLVGTQPLSVPIENCVLRTDFPILLPFSLTGPSRAEVYLPPVGYPVQVRTQGITFGAAGLHATNALELQCR